MAIVIGFSGIDGSGKTTVAQQLVKRLEGMGLKVSYRHELDFAIMKPAFDIFSRLISSRAAGTFKEEFVERTYKGNGFASILYYVLSWVDNMATFFRFKLSGSILVHDRWIYDQVASMRLRGMNNQILINLILTFPRPDVLFLLKLNPLLAFERKKGEPRHSTYDASFYANLQKEIFDIISIRRPKKLVIVDSSDKVESIVNHVLSFLLDSEGGVAR